MTTIAILPEGSGTLRNYRAIAGDKQSVGKTAGEALDALTAQLDAADRGTLVVVQQYQPDRFFTAAQIQRLEELMTRWRAARAAGGKLPAVEQQELDDLVEAEVHASAERARALLQGLTS
jgi:hypothetical protein